MLTKNRRITLSILCLIGLCLTAELIYIFFKANFETNAAPSFCTINSVVDCDGVAKTSYALFLGVPLAIWGALFYLMILFLTFVDKIAVLFKKTPLYNLLLVFKNPSSYITTLGLFSFVISIILAAISIFTIQKICALCFVTYVINLIISIVAKSKGLFLKDIKNTIFDFLDGVKKYSILFVIVLIAAIGILVYTQTSMVFTPALRAMKSFEEFQKMPKNIYGINGNTLGNPDGKIVIYAYSDFLCPFCKVTNIMIHKLAKEDKDVMIYHMNFPLDSACNENIRQTIHQGSCILAKYTIAAENQGAYWGMANAIYDNMPENEDRLMELGKQLGMDEKLLFNDAHSNEVDMLLKKQIQRAVDLGIMGTPTLIIDGIEYQSAMPYEKIKTLVKQAKKRHQSAGD